MATWNVQAAYDSEEHYWYTVDSDVPGLVTGGESLERLRERVHAILPELIELNAHLIIDKSRLEGPHSVRLLAFHESVQAVAA